MNLTIDYNQFEKCKKCGSEDWHWTQAECPDCGYNGKCDHPNLESGVYSDYCPDCGYSQGY